MKYSGNPRNESTNCIFANAFQIGQSNYKQPHKRLLLLLQFSPSKQAQMLLPQEALSVLTENLRVGVKEGGKVTETRTRGTDAHLVVLW